MADDSDSFESTEPDYRRAREPEQLSLFLSLDGYEGPIDVLLTLGRDQKVDLTQISILQLADQYLAFIRQAQTLNLEIAADYLVMAAWLAYLKSRLLLPSTEEDGEGMTSEELAEILRFQLQRLEAMREVGDRLMARPRLGVDTFARGMPESITNLAHPVYDVTLFELLKAYGDHKVRNENTSLRIVSTKLYAVEEAVKRLKSMLGHMPNWQTLISFLPVNLRGSLLLRSAVASTFVASLELAKEGHIELRQDNPYGPIFLRNREQPR
jgi:segregation and condensation protein A